MRTLVFASLTLSAGLAPVAADAQRLGGTNAPMVRPMSPPPMQGGWHPAPKPNPGGWNGVPKPRPGNWNPTPRPPYPGTPTPPGGWNNPPKPGYPGGWNKPPKPGYPGGWHNTPQQPYPGTPYPPGGWNKPPKPTYPGNWNGTPKPHQPRWGGYTKGRWNGGWNAPGGWQAYHRPSRGWNLPTYWNTPGFYINDYSTYGLSAPSYGYNWMRYYDDAVLADDRGQVWDSVSGIDWNRYDQGYGYAGDDYAYAADGEPGHDGGYYERRDNGVGGAVIGGVVGGVAGNVIAGRGNRLAGTLIGAGVGATAGYVIDRAEDRGRYAAPPPQGYGSGYAPPAEVVQGGYSNGYAQGGYSQGGYVSGGYWYPPATTTTVTVQSAPLETITTTTEYVEESTSYSTPRKVWRAAPRKKVWKAAPRCGC